MKLVGVALFFLCSSLGGHLDADYAVSAEKRDGEWWCTVSAQRANLRDVIDALAIKLGLEVDGLLAIDRHEEITVELQARSARDVFTRLAGTIGMTAEMRTRSLALRPMHADAMSLDELRRQAIAAYLRALRAYPDHPNAAHAKLEEARIEEARGNSSASLQHYEDVIRLNKNSELFPEALMKCAELLMKSREWASAAERLTELLRIDRRHPYEIPARLDLARCEAMLGDHEHAFYMLDVVDTYAPTSEPEEIQNRLMIRARAQIAASHPTDAAETLEHVEKLGLRDGIATEMLELHARTDEALGDGSTACKAWIAYAQRVEGAERSDALIQAARLALETGDEMAALFIGRLAEESGGGDTAKSIREQVAKSLGVAKVARPRDDHLETIARAERLVAAGVGAEAAPILASLYVDRKELDPESYLRVVTAYAKALDASIDVDAAMRILREALGELRDSDTRKRIYVLAGELYEARGRLDDAAAAYQGRL